MEINRINVNNMGKNLILVKISIPLKYYGHFKNNSIDIQKLGERLMELTEFGHSERYIFRLEFIEEDDIIIRTSYTDDLGEYKKGTVRLFSDSFKGIIMNDEFIINKNMGMWRG